MSAIKLAVLGDPIAHSRSPYLHLALARSMDFDVTYEHIQTTEDTLADTVEKLRREDYTGFNCTMPLKTSTASLADTLSEQARILRSCNTVHIRQGKLHGSTTDGDGMIYSLTRMMGELHDKRILILGAGGSARSIALAFDIYACAGIDVLNRTIDSAKGLCESLRSKSRFDAITPDKLCEYAGTADIIINSTSQGMAGFDPFPDLSFLECARRDAVVVDTIYNPPETSLLLRARELGLRTFNGYGMLVCQGILSFETWMECKVTDGAVEAAFKAVETQT